MGKNTLGTHDIVLTEKRYFFNLHVQNHGQSVTHLKAKCYQSRSNRNYAGKGEV